MSFLLHFLIVYLNMIHGKKGSHVHVCVFFFLFFDPPCMHILFSFVCRFFCVDDLIFLSFFSFFSLLFRDFGCDGGVGWRTKSENICVLFCFCVT